MRVFYKICLLVFFIGTIGFSVNNVFAELPVFDLFEGIPENDQSIIVLIRPHIVDADDDNIADRKDLCPLEPEIYNGFEDDDGCPDEIPFADITELPEQNKKKTGGGDNLHRTRGTFGISYTTYQPLVECGYSHNGVCYDITENWYTPFDKVKIETGVPQEIIIKGYFSKGVKAIGWGLVPEVGMYHKAEVKIQVYIDHYDKIDYEKLYTEQKHNILDMDSIIYEYYQEPCGYVNSMCDVLKISNIIFMVEPVFEKIAIYGIDDNGRTQVTFLNEGYDIFGESLNEPLESKVSVGKGGALYPQRAGIVDLTLVEYKTNTWQDEYGYLWQGDNYKSFKIISAIPVPIKEPDKITSIIDRNHSEFHLINEFELKRALEEFDASTLISKIPDPIPTDLSIPNKELEELKLEYNKMIEAYKAANYLMYSQPDHTKFQQFQIQHEELNKKYADSLSSLLLQIEKLEK